MCCCPLPDEQRVDESGLLGRIACRTQDFADPQEQIDQGGLTISNVKRLFLSRFQLELSITALGYTRLRQALSDPSLHDVCTLRTLRSGQVVVKQPCPTTPPGVWSKPHLDMAVGSVFPGELLSPDASPRNYVPLEEEPWKCQLHGGSSTTECSWDSGLSSAGDETVAPGSLESTAQSSSAVALNKAVLSPWRVDVKRTFIEVSIPNSRLPSTSAKQRLRSLPARMGLH